MYAKACVLRRGLNPICVTFIKSAATYNNYIKDALAWPSLQVQNLSHYMLWLLRTSIYLA